MSQTQKIFDPFVFKNERGESPTNCSRDRIKQWKQQREVNVGFAAETDEGQFPHFLSGLEIRFHGHR